MNYDRRGRFPNPVIIRVSNHLFTHCTSINLGQAEIIWEYDGYGEIIVENDCGHDESDHGSGEDIVSADGGYDVASYYLVAISGG